MFDLIFVLVFLFTYLFLIIFKNIKAIRVFIYLCLAWALGLIWGMMIPNCNDIIAIGGLIYGVPLTIVSFISWYIQKEGEKNKTFLALGMFIITLFFLMLTTLLMRLSSVFEKNISLWGMLLTGTILVFSLIGYVKLYKQAREKFKTI